MTLGLTEAMGLLLVPSLVTNLWQAAVGGQAPAILRRTWPFMAVATATVWIGALALRSLDLSLLSALLGLLLVVYAGLSLSGWRATIAVRQEPWLAPLAGALNGVLTGMTGSFVVPGVMYLQALGLPRDQLVQAMGLLFSLSTLALALALQGNGFLNVELGALSAAAVLPALLGMVIGQRLRKQLSEALFQRIFFVALLILGFAIIAKALVG
jgi:uncharacterized membrane protein YfcA